MRPSFVYDQNDVFAVTTITSREMTSRRNLLLMTCHYTDLGSASKQ